MLKLGDNVSQRQIRDTDTHSLLLKLVIMVISFLLYFHIQQIKVETPNLT